MVGAPCEATYRGDVELKSARDRHIGHGLTVVLHGLTTRHEAPEVGREAAVALLNL